MSKTNWTIAITIAITLINAAVPFMSTGVQGIVTTLLLAVVSIFHIDDVKIASAAAPKAVSSQNQ